MTQDTPLMGGNSTPFPGRHTGTFVMETDNYGFIVRAVNSQGNAVHFPGEGGCFLSGTTAGSDLGNKNGILKDLNGSRLTFLVRKVESGKHRGKLEAYDIRESNG